MFGHIDILYMATLVGFQVFAHIYIWAFIAESQ